ncbi:MAG: Asp-tRNA(Asn)/Glu-tRNA(Gln) amidotransferase subunit GatA [Candidatus Saccharimonadales bacterium]
MSQWPPLAEIAAQVTSGQQKAIDLVEQSLKLIAAKTDYGSVLWTLENRARQRARAIDEAVKNGENPGLLAGVPFIAKDNFLCFGGETTAASHMLQGFQAPYQATVIERLEAAGAVCVAKANMDAFAHGSSGENSDYKITKNPYDKSRVPGGSSSGSAAAVALQLTPFAIGSDTGGSIRLPASFCGVVGYKPTYGLVSRSGIVAMSSSCDVAGPITQSAADAALVLEAMAGRDPLDSTSIERSTENYSQPNGSLKGKTIGLVQQYISQDNLHPDVRVIIEQSLAKLSQAGATVREISLPATALSLPVYYIIVAAEISSNLSRYDGQRFPYSCQDAKNLDESYFKAREIGLGKESKRRIIIGSYVLSSGYYEAYYQKAQEVRTKIINEFEAAFSEVDFLLGPTAGITAFPIGEIVDDPLQMYFTDMMTVAANLAGICAISLPAGTTAQGLPVGLHLMAPRRADRELLQTARATEALLGWHQNA